MPWILGWCDLVLRMTDTELEAQIEAARKQGVESTDPETRRFAFKRMAELIAQRSPKRIEQMERARGLRAP